MDEIENNTYIESRCSPVVISKLAIRIFMINQEFRIRNLFENERINILGEDFRPFFCEVLSREL